jgi:ubiquinone/menaquinone biosynthesis C-methylase UbiE
MATAAYHLCELAIALDPTDPRYSLPTIPIDCHRVLDVGCGAGQTLMALRLSPTIEAWGVDVDGEAIALGKRLAPHLRLLLTRGERLPPDIQEIDFAYSRVALPYMEIPQALAELARVLRPGGMLWLSLHPVSMTLREWARALRRGRFRDLLGRSYVLACGAWFWLTGRTFPAPWGARRTESWQSLRGIKRALSHAGFVGVTVERSAHFHVTARRGSPETVSVPS